MLGIANEAGIVCDYTLSLTQVRTDFVHRSLKSGDLCMLHYCNHQRQLPSYIPPLENSLETEYLPIRSSNSPFRAGQQCPVNLTLRQDQTLSLKGTVIDEIERHEDWSHIQDSCKDSNRASYFSEVYHNVLCYLQDHYERLKDDQSLVMDEFGPTVDYENIFEVIGRTIDPNAMARKNTGGAERGPRDGPGAPVSNIHYEHVLNHAMLDHQHYAQIRDKCIFQTISGYIGFGSRFALPGDVVVIFDGAMTPFLIRKEKNRHDLHTGRYTIVSDSYLHGWMYGNYFDHTVLEEDGGIPDHLNDPPRRAPTSTDREDPERSGADISPQVDRCKDSFSTANDTRKPILRKQTFVIC